MDIPEEIILIVDDDELNSELLGEYVNFLGYSTVFASSGRQGLERIGPDIAVVLLDVMMPEMDGFEVTRRIREHPTCPDLPVILVTALTDRDDKLRGVEAGANDFITKPIDPAELRVRLNAQVKMKRAKEALEAAREYEVAIAAEIQSTLLQGEPPADIPNVSIAVFTASSAKIDGDFYHFFVYNDRQFDIAVGDVMGKGIPAAVLGAAAKSAIQQAISRIVVDHPGWLPDPTDIVGRVHRNMTPHLIPLNTFVTLAYAHVDLDKQRLALVDCGHTSMVHYQSAEEKAILVSGDNLPLGVIVNEILLSTEVSFLEGDIFVLYSDGITEAEDLGGAMFGASRLSEVITKHHEDGAEGIVQAIRSAVEAFTGTSAVSDDVTCVALKIEISPLQSNSQRSLNIVSSLDCLQSVSLFVRDSCAHRSDLMVEDIDALELVVNEAVVNIIDHGYNGQSDQPISINVEMIPGAVSISIYDWAAHFDRSTAASPTFDGSRFDGFGLFIIDQSTTEATFTRDLNGRNCSTFIRTIPFIKGPKSQG